MPPMRWMLLLLLLMTIIKSGDREEEDQNESVCVSDLEKGKERGGKSSAEVLPKEDDAGGRVLADAAGAAAVVANVVAVDFIQIATLKVLL